MNITMQMCGLIIALFLLFLYKSHKTLGLHSEKVFSSILGLTILCISLDALSVVAIHYQESLPEILVKLSCKAYLMSMVWVGYINFCYVTLELNSTPGSHQKLVRTMTLVTAIENLVILCLPIALHREGNNAFTSGPAVVITYVFTISYILFTLNVARFILKKKNSRRGMTVIVVTGLWILAAAIQSIRNELLLVGFSMAVGVMVLYTVMENPDSYLDRVLGCFNSYALYSYLTMHTESARPFSVLDISVTDIKALEDKGIRIEEAGRQIIRGLSDLGIPVFKNLSAGLICVSEDEKKIQEASNQVTKLISAYGEAANAALVFTVSDALQFGKPNDLLKFLAYVRGKSEGRLATTVNVSDKMISQYRDIRIVEEMIDQALEEDRVEVFLQPICKVGSGQVVSAEALVRIRNTDGTLLSPGRFIPVAENSGQINRLGERVLEKVCAFLKDSEALSLGLETIHVNLSAVQCDDNHASGKLSKIVESYGINPENISFEITETAVSNAKDILLENMNALISKGFNFALDDFGKGESNLMYIVELPVDIIKLDMDMSKAYFSNPRAKIVVRAVTDMTDQLGLPIVAEGIETKDELDQITDAGVAFIQGYYYSKPLPMEEFITYLREHEKTPAAPAAAAAVPKEEEMKPSEPEAKATIFPLTNKRVLLVEDNEISADIANDILEDAGLSVEIAEDGMVAVDMVSKSAPGYYDLVLMDIRMPIMDGYEATRRIRALSDAALSQIPIIALTAQDTEEDRKAALDAGMNGLLPKPLTLENFGKMAELPEAE